MDDPTYDLGLDLKYGITNNLTLDFTVNTDFAQVEADNQQVNLTRFSLFFPEKRRFFQERTSNFDFEFGGSDRLFYSRRIGLASGRQIPLIGGTRVIGRIGKWDIGFLNMQAARDSDQPAENFGVLRLRRQIVNSSSYAGCVMTSRLGEDGRYNLAYGADAIMRVSGDDYLTLNWAQTIDEDGGNAFDIARVRARWFKNRQQGLTYDVSLARSGSHYNPGIGFQRRKDFSSLSNKLEYGWVPSDASPLSKHELTLESDLFIRNGDRQTDTWKTGIDWNVLFKNGAGGEISLNRTFEDLVRSFSISGINIPEGTYSNYTAEMRYSMPSAEQLRTSVQSSVGFYFDGSQVQARLDPTWTLSRFFELGGSYRFDRIDFPASDETFTSHLGRLRAQRTLNALFSVASFVQSSSSADVAIANFRLRFNPREGNDFYLVYNEGFNTDRPFANPPLPVSEGRTILLKYSYTFLK